MINYMKNIFKTIKNALLKAFGKLLDFLVSNADVAVKVVNTVKEVVNNPAIDWVVALTPTKSDDKVLAKAKKAIPDLLIKLGLAMNIISELEAQDSPEKAIGIVLSKVSQSLPKEGQAIFYRELAGLISEALSDGEISTGEAVGIAQLVFKKIL